MYNYIVYLYQWIQGLWNKHRTVNTTSSDSQLVHNSNVQIDIISPPPTAASIAPLSPIPEQS